MAYQEIPREQWKDFCDEFSKQHEGWLVSVEIVDETGEPNHEVIASELALWGVTVDELQDQTEVHIIAGDQPRHVTHVIRDPAAIGFEQDEQGGHTGLRIDTQEGPSVLVRFRTAAVPESVDAISDIEA